MPHNKAKTDEKAEFIGNSSSTLDTQARMFWPDPKPRKRECPRNTRKSREASENNYASLASYSLKIKAGSKNSFSANLCVLCASAVAISFFLTAEAQSTQRFAEKKSKGEPQHTSAQRFGCGPAALVPRSILFCEFQSSPGASRKGAARRE